MGSDTEVEIGATYIHAQAAIPTQIALIKLKHLQHPTPIQVDKSTAVVFAKNIFKEIKIQIYEILLYPRQQRTTTLLNILKARKRQPHRLF